MYGPEDGSELKDAMGDIEQYQELRQWSSKQWVGLLEQYFLNAKSITVIGKPSASMAQKLEDDEKVRIDAQVKKLGPEGIKAATKVLDEAKAEHDAPIPTEILTSFKIPEVKSISWIPVQSLQESGKGRKSVPSKDQALVDKVSVDGQELPFFVQYDHVEVNYISCPAAARANRHYSPTSCPSMATSLLLTCPIACDRPCIPMVVAFVR